MSKYSPIEIMYGSHLQKFSSKCLEHYLLDCRIGQVQNNLEEAEAGKRQEKKKVIQNRIQITETQTQSKAKVQKIKLLSHTVSYSMLSLSLKVKSSVQNKQKNNAIVKSVL